jgi:hypothetical protein
MNYRRKSPVCDDCAPLDAIYHRSLMDVKGNCSDPLPLEVAGWDANHIQNKEGHDDLSTKKPRP